MTLDWLTATLLLIAALALAGGARRWVRAGAGGPWLPAAAALWRPASEETMRDSAERLRATFEQAAVGIAHVAPDGRWLRVNQKLCDIVGYSHEQLVNGARFQDITHPDDLDADLRFVERLLAGELPTYAMEKRYIRRDGEVIWINLTVSLVREASLAPRYFISVIEDISERKRTEQALRDSEEAVRQLADELTQRVGDVTDRTAQLEAANRELEAFSYSVSHDLRAPLRAIDGFSAALLEDHAPQLDPAGRIHLQRVRVAAQRMGELIDGLLSLSRLTRSEMRVTRVDLSALAQEVVVGLRSADPMRQVEVVVAPQLLARGDAGLLRVLLDNLLGNAWKYTGRLPRARVELGITTVVGGASAFFVRDDGVGFEMAYADKLFGAFQRLHTRDEFPGSGIGLATVQRIVHRHGGRIWAESTVGHGATFYFTLPG